MKLIGKYFNELTDLQLNQFSMLQDLYADWNSKINLISRKDMDDLYLKHVLHSLAIAKVCSFRANTQVLDVGTGGGFPGIPLAILFPDCQFHLVDSIGKKIKVVNAVAETLSLTNITTANCRAEAIAGQFDFVVSRAVTAMPEFVTWIKAKIAKKQRNGLKNGVLYLKGGDLTEELKDFPKATIYHLKDYFEEAFFETKKVVHLPIKYKG